MLNVYVYSIRLFWKLYWILVVHVLNNCYVFCNVPSGIKDIMASVCLYQMYISQLLLHVHSFIH